MELRNLSKCFGSNKVLENINYDFPKTGLIAIEGRSGSGKSTLLNMMATFEAPSGGAITHNGKTISKLSPKKKAIFRNEECGFVFQHFNLISGVSVLDNVSMPLYIGGEKAKTARKTALDLLKRFHLEEFSERKVDSLSGGEKQRVAILRAFIRKPSILLCDEPTGALDESNSETVMELLEEISTESLVIVVTHNSALAERYCQTILRIENRGLTVVRECVGKTSPFIKHKTQPKRNKVWQSILLKKNLGLDKKKNVFGFLSVLFAYCSLLLSLAFVYGSFQSIEEERNNVILYDVFSISEKKTYEIPSSPLRLSRNERPDANELTAMFGPDVLVANDYSYFVSPYTAFKHGGVNKDPCLFTPVREFIAPDIVQGRIPDKGNLCLVNEAFAQKYEAEVDSYLNFTSQSSITKDDKTQDIKIDIGLRIVGVVHEFPFLSVPQVYYLQEYVESKMASYYLKEFDNLSIKDLVDQADGSSPWTSYDYLVYSSSREKSNEIRALIDNQANDGLFISSSSYEVEQTFTSLVKSTATSIIPFLIIEIIGASFIIGTVSYSSYLERRKESAIMQALGARNGDIASIYVAESFLVSLLGAVASLAISFALTFALNPLLRGTTGFSSILSLPLLGIGKYRFIVEIVLLLLSLFSSFIGSGIPIVLFKKNDIVERLRDE